MRRFKRQDYFRYKRLKRVWRKPKGSESKMRKQKGGSGPLPKIGYGTPKAERNMINGKKFMVVHNPNELEKLDNQYAVLIGSGVGLKKTKLISEKAKEKEITILNMKKVKASIKKEKELKKKKEKEDKKEQKKKPIDEESIDASKMRQSVGSSYSSEKENKEKKEKKKSDKK